MNYNRAMQKILTAALAAAFVLPACAADISGSWTLTGDVVGNAISMKCAFTQDGATFSGTCTGSDGAAQTKGSVADNKVTFTHTVNRGQAYDLTYTGTLDAAGASITGDIAVAGVSGTFSATKDVAATATKPEVAGNWTITGDIVGNPVNMKCALKRDGDKLSGTCAYDGAGQAATTGSIAANKVALQNQAGGYDLTYTGTLDAAGTAMSGEIGVAGVTGTFSGTKDK
jgi:hypothetical protein